MNPIKPPLDYSLNEMQGALNALSPSYEQRQILDSGIQAGFRCAIGCWPWGSKHRSLTRHPYPEWTTGATIDAGEACVGEIDFLESLLQELEAEEFVELRQRIQQRRELFVRLVTCWKGHNWREVEIDGPIRCSGCGVDHRVCEECGHMTWPAAKLKEECARILGRERYMEGKAAGFPKEPFTLHDLDIVYTAGLRGQWQGDNDLYELSQRPHSNFPEEVDA